MIMMTKIQHPIKYIGGDQSSGWIIRIAKKYNIPVIADGGIKYSGDLVKAVAAGAIKLNLSIPEVVTDIRIIVIGNAFEWALRNGEVDFAENMKRSISHYLDGVFS